MCFWQEYYYIVNVVSFFQYMILHNMLVCTVIGAVNFDHLVKIMYARFLYCQIIIFPFVINK